ncbi:MAG TPA: hypothetical protein EYP32_07625 [Aquificaceae bacterium]|nr:hypothetical protein [Aquificaceae bacterium]
MHYLLPVLGILSFLSPCMWNSTLILRAYIKNGGYQHLFLLLLSRLVLFNSIALFLYTLRHYIIVPSDLLIWVQAVTALVFIIGFPLMERIGIAPIDLSPQFMFPRISLPPGVSLGFSIPYCSIPFIVLLSFYSLSLSNPFYLFNGYWIFVSLPSIAAVLFPEKALRIIAKIIPSVPPITGFVLLISLWFMIDANSYVFAVYDYLRNGTSLVTLMPFMFLLGFFTSLGPSTLPFLPVVFGMLISGRVLPNTAGFFLSFIFTHALIGSIASTGGILLMEVFRIDLFNLILAILLLLIALSILGFLPLRIEVARLNPIGNTPTGCFALGIAYTFSLCPSCTSFLLGAIVLSASVGSIPEASLLMSIYAIGRSIPIFISGMIVGSISSFIKEYRVHINRGVAVIFLLMSVYFFKNFMEARI